MSRAWWEALLIAGLVIAVGVAASFVVREFVATGEVDAALEATPTPELTRDEAIGLVRAYLAEQTYTEEILFGLYDTKLQKCPTYADSTWTAQYKSTDHSWVVKATSRRLGPHPTWTLYERTNAVVSSQKQC